MEFTETVEEYRKAKKNAVSWCSKFFLNVYDLYKKRQMLLISLVHVWKCNTPFFITSFKDGDTETYH